MKGMWDRQKDVAPFKKFKERGRKGRKGRHGEQRREKGGQMRGKMTEGKKRKEGRESS